MKWLIFLLLAANLLFAGFIYVRDRLPNPDAQLVGQQINADQIRIVPPRPPAAPLAVAPAPGPGVCLQWGSFAAAELPKAQGAIDGLALGERVRKTDVAVSTSYWIFIPPLKSKLEMEKKANELKARGITEYSLIVEAGRWRNAISLGFFRTEDAASKQLALLRTKGVRSAQIGGREQRTTQTAFLIRDPTEAQTAQLASLNKRFPANDMRAVDCPPS